MERLDRGTKCIVYGCDNHTNEGTFVGDMCYPCHYIITTGDLSQSSENFIYKLYMKKKTLEADLYKSCGRY